MKHLILLSCMTLLGGCANHGPLDLSYHGSSEGYVAAQLAAASWNDTCQADLIHVSWAHDGADVEVYALWMQEPKPGELGTTYRNWLGDAYKIEFDDGPIHPLVSTLTHEFGHALGLDHEATGIMRAMVNPDELTDQGLLEPGMITARDCVKVSH
jgi:hypothetical protein